MNLKTQHPLLLVTEVVTFGVIVYSSNGNAAQAAGHALAKGLRGFIVSSLPAGTGVSEVTVVNHGQYEPRDRAEPLPEPPRRVSVTQAAWNDLLAELSNWNDIDQPAKHLPPEEVLAQVERLLCAMRRTGQVPLLRGQS